MVGEARRRLLLLTVATVEDESRALKELDFLSRKAQVDVLPVLNRGGLPARLAQVLTKSDIDVEIMGETAAFSVGDSRSNPSELRTSRSGMWPATVFASDGVPPDLLRLAAGICRVRPQLLSSLAGSTTPPSNEENRTALVLVNPEAAAVSDVLSGLAALSGDAFCYGIVYAVDAIEARFGILKCLATSSLSAQKEFAIVSSDHRADPSAQAPSCLHGPSLAVDAAWLLQRRSLLIFSGHSNPLDAAVAETSAFCARAGATAEFLLEDHGLYPCFRDGQCFRQPAMGRSPEDSAGLLRIQDAQADVLILSGCSTAALGRSWFSANNSLSYQCQQGYSLASVVSASVSIERLEFSLLFLALLSQGLPLGEVVRAANQVKADHDHATPLPAGVGPFVLLGNPCLRLDGIGLHEQIGWWHSRTRFSVDCSGSASEHCGRILAIRLRVVAPAVVVLRRAPPQIWCRGVCRTEAGETTLYLWVSGVESEESQEPLQRPMSLEFECHEEDPFAAVPAALDRFLGQLAFWMLFLASYKERSRENPPLESVLERALAALPGLGLELSVAATALRPQPGMVVGQVTMVTAQAAAWARLTDATGKLLECMVEIACSFGTLQSSGWEDAFPPSRGARAPRVLCVRKFPRMGPAL